MQARLEALCALFGVNLPMQVWKLVFARSAIPVNVTLPSIGPYGPMHISPHRTGTTCRRRIHPSPDQPVLNDLSQSNCPNEPVPIDPSESQRANRRLPLSRLNRVAVPFSSHIRQCSLPLAGSMSAVPNLCCFNRRKYVPLHPLKQ
jgi:hypothetical protein